MSEEIQPSLFQRMGGDDAVKKIMTAFYQRVLRDPMLGDFFVNVNLEQLQRMQHEFFCAALGGPIKYSGNSLREIHSGMDIQPRHLTCFLEHLLDTLREQKFDENDIYEIYSRIHTYSDEITGISTVDG